MFELTDKQITRLIETTHSTDVPSRYIRIMAGEIAFHRGRNKRLIEWYERDGSVGGLSQIMDEFASSDSTQLLGKRR